VATEYARLMAENQALRASLQQQQQSASQAAAATSSATQAMQPPGGAKGESGDSAAPSPKPAAKDPPKGPDSSQSAIVRATAARVDQRHAEAAHLMAEAFAADAELANDLESGQRYLAACSAALAAAGKGADSADLTPADQAHLRKL